MRKFLKGECFLYNDRSSNPATLLARNVGWYCMPRRVQKHAAVAWWCFTKNASGRTAL